MNIYLAATGGHETIVREIRPPYILESYLSVKPWQLEYMRSDSCHGFMLDSGAFSWMRGKRKQIDFSRYVDEYGEFVIEHRIELFFEMDVDSTIGYENVRKLTERLERRVGRQCVPVWHFHRGKQAFVDMCRDYEYVAIGGMVSKDAPRNAKAPYYWMIKTAHRNGARIHGLGFTDTRQLRNFQWDSVDSTTWHNAARWGHPQFLGRMRGEINRYRTDVTKQSGPFAKPGQRCVLTPEALYRQNLATWAEYARRMENGK